MIERSRAKRVRDFGCGELLTIASGASASLHYYKRDAAHAHPNVDHEYPSHSLVFTDVGEWQYHETQRRATVDTRVLVAGTGLRHYACSHQRGVPNECFIVAVKDDALDDDGDRLFPKSVLSLTPEMLLHRRAIAAAASDPAAGREPRVLALRRRRTGRRDSKPQDRIRRPYVVCEAGHPRTLRETGHGCRDRPRIASIAIHIYAAIPRA